MDIFIRNVPIQSTNKQLEDFLRKPLSQLSVFTFHCAKMKAKSCAILTILDKNQAEEFLRRHGGPATKPGDGKRHVGKLIFHRSPLFCAPSNKAPDELLLRSLRMDETKRIERSTLPRANQAHDRQKERGQRSFEIIGLSCGIWGYPKNHLELIQYFQDTRRGTILFGRTTVTILLYEAGQWACRLDFPLYSIDNIILGDYSKPTVSLSLALAPKFYVPSKSEMTVEGSMDVSSLFKLMDLNMKIQARQPPKIRVCGINQQHEHVAGTSLAYQVKLADHFSLEKVHHMTQRDNKMPPTIRWPTRRYYHADKFEGHLNTLIGAIGENKGFPWTVGFQIQRLATDGILSPFIVLKLLPYIRRLMKLFGTIATAEAIRRMARKLPIPGPDSDATMFGVKSLALRLQDYAEAFHMIGSMYDLEGRYEHIGLVHKVTITPAGMYLDGPEPEVKNRVLRRYLKYPDYFIRVTFSDEDGEAVRFESQASLDKIFRGRFKQMLDGSIDIAGRAYTFLGFSHSSLRSQTCWFMAPFIQDRKLIYAKNVIQGLGDFSKIRSPARCAARIGQSFSDATCTVPVKPSAVKALSDVERNGRCFSDGCGTLSEELLQQVWLRYAVRRDLKPTLLQIRFAGAKGMLSLDSRLEGEQICLRPSMLKFEGANAWDIEICGASLKPLPMFLNRQFIKILEDLGVPDNVFMSLQAAEVDRLRKITLAPVNAATFLEHNYVGTTAKMPELIRRLNDIGLEFQNDPFLHALVEMAALSSLRELKYRSRIPVEQAFTLYGIMDETGYLQKGEVYVVVERSSTSGREVLVNGRVIVTRAPAMFPGDVQFVKAVDIPIDSPLNAISNCIVFSQHGDRDLPSCLSGGDLDGDLYNIIFDPSLMPKVTYQPADFPRVAPLDFKREIETRDMTDFFLDFMASDRLGQISTLHMVWADVSDLGTLAPECLTLAEMASTAVDFSKTGIKVDMSNCPKQLKYRPDFMAPGPIIQVESKVAVLGEEEDPVQVRELDEVAALDPESTSYRYYESDKVLGKLFRAIDERTFLAELQQQFRKLATAGPRLMDRLWAYVKRETLLVQYDQYMNYARELRDGYEENLFDTMHAFSPHPSQPLSEMEVFAGAIMGRNTGGQSKRTREFAKEMKERFDRDVAFTIDRILKGDDGAQSDGQEALPRAVACLAVGMNEPGMHMRGGEYLESWRYVAAAICLAQLERWQGRWGPLRPL